MKVLKIKKILRLFVGKLVGFFFEALRIISTLTSGLDSDGSTPDLDGPGSDCPGSDGPGSGRLGPSSDVGGHTVASQPTSNIGRGSRPVKEDMIEIRG